MTAQQSPTSVALWEADEWTFSDPASVEQPELVAVFEHQDRVIRRPAFRDVDGSWKVRFAPTSPGPWTFRVEGSDLSPERSGRFIAHDGGSTGGISGHGFLRARSGAGHLEHGDGAPFFWLGDTHWRFTHESWDSANKTGWTSQFRGTVDLRVRQGFTVYQVNLMMVDWGETESPYFLPGTTELDTNYFTTVVDPRMKYLADAGLVTALGLGWHGAVDQGAERVVAIAREVVARYGAYPMVWTLGGEVPGYEPELVAERLDRWRTVAREIRAADEYRHPMTAHATNERPLPTYFVGDDWFDFALNQHGHGDSDTSRSWYAQFFAEHPQIAMVEGESLYEGLTSVEPIARRTVTDTMVRQAAYRAFQSGCCGYTYGAQGGWDGAWDPRPAETFWGSMAWYDGVDLPGGHQLGHLRAFYESLPWQLLRPDPSLFRPDDPINAAFYPPAVTSDREHSVVVILFDEVFHPGEPSGVLTQLRDETYRLSWFDPRSGRVTLMDDVRPAAGRLTVPDRPDARDWLFLARVVDSKET